MQKICVNFKHIVHPPNGAKSHKEDGESDCMLMTNREYLLGRNRLRTGKTRG